MLQRISSRLLPVTLGLVAACGSSSTGPSTPPDMVGDISIVRGAEFLTPPQDRGAAIRCYLRDPDGHLIEVGQTSAAFREQGTGDDSASA